MRRSWFRRSTIQWCGLVAAPILAVLAYWLLPEVYQNTQGDLVALSHGARATAALGVWMAIWWVTEAIPIYATALLPLAVLPLARVATVKETAAPYGHELIYLFLGGFILALSMERWGLHRRIALKALRIVGCKPRNIIGGFMAITALLSMWVSNTATTITMLPIALSVITWFRAQPSVRKISSTEDTQNFELCLLLGIAYAASIGGVGTLVGTPPNLFLASFIRDQTGIEISFVKWMGIGVPFVILFLPLAWLLLTRVLCPLGAAEIQARAPLEAGGLRAQGRMKPGEWSTLIVFTLTALAWILRPALAKIAWGSLRPFAGLSDAGIAIIAAVVLFVIPVDVRRRTFVMDWETAMKLPWGLLILFGGGLSLAAAIKVNGVGEFIGAQVAVMAGVPGWCAVLFVTTLMVLLTELASNTASSATLIPILFAVSQGLSLEPFLLVVPATIAASCAFMLPVSTPPNAVVFGSGFITIPQMFRVGFWLSIVGIILITSLTYFIALPLLIR